MVFKRLAKWIFTFLCLNDESRLLLPAHLESYITHNVHASGPLGLVFGLCLSVTFWQDTVSATVAAILRLVLCVCGGLNQNKQRWVFASCQIMGFHSIRIFIRVLEYCVAQPTAWHPQHLKGCCPRGRLMVEAPS